jgi:hypothetical protein
MTGSNPSRRTFFASLASVAALPVLAPAKPALAKSQDFILAYSPGEYEITDAMVNMGNTRLVAHFDGIRVKPGQQIRLQII